MKKSNTRTCKVPKCSKETYNNKALFCGEHEREFRNYSKNSGKVFAGVASLFVGGFIVKKKL